MHVTVERCRVKSVAAILACILFIVATLRILAQGSAVTLLVGVAGVVTFTGSGIGWIVQSVRAGPGLVVGDAGIDDHSSLVSVGGVLGAWVDVRSVSELSLASTSFAVVEVRAKEVYLARLGLFARMAARANRRMVGSPDTVSSVGLKTSVSNLSTVMREGFEEYHRRRPET